MQRGGAQLLEGGFQVLHKARGIEQHTVLAGVGQVLTQALAVGGGLGQGDGLVFVGLQVGGNEFWQAGGGQQGAGHA